jgi:putative ABC transport system permease protein
MGWFRRVHNTIAGSGVDSTLDEEMRFHIEERTNEYVRRGMTRAQAHRAAHRRFGSLTLAKDRARDADTMRWLWDLGQDLRYATRVFSRNPGFAVVAVVTLALGIGTNTAIFSVVDTVLLQPLPYKNADGLVRIVENVPASESFNGSPMRTDGMAVDEFAEWRTQTQTLSHMAVYATGLMTMATSEGGVRLNGAQVSPALFPMLGIQALMGRVFNDAEERSGRDVEVLLSETAWRKYFNAAPNIVGRTLVLDGRGYTVIGVLSTGFGFPDRDTEVWKPFVVVAPAGPRIQRVRMIARLKDTALKAAAVTESNLIGRQLRGTPTAMPASNAPRFEIVSLKDELVAPVKPALLVLEASVGFVLLIACANVANLLLARGASRQREIAIRRALGAGRGRLIRQILTESLILSVLGGAVGTALALGGIRLLKALAAVDAPRSMLAVSTAIIPRLDEVSIDGRVLAFTIAVSLLTGLCFGLAAALPLSRVDQMHVIHEATASASSGLGFKRRNRTRSLLVVSEIGLATVLLVGAGLLIKSFVKLASVNLGYDPANVLTFHLVLPQNRYIGAQTDAMADQLVNRLHALSSVQAVGIANLLPLSPIIMISTFRTTSAVSASLRSSTEPPDTRVISPDFLRALGMRVVDGRGFLPSDGETSQKVVLINRAFARREFPGQNPLGKSLYAGGAGGRPTRSWEIVGVVDDVRQLGLDKEPAPQIFTNVHQSPGSLSSGPGSGPGTYFAVRTSGDPMAIVAQLRSVIRELDAQATLDDVAAMEHRISSSITSPRFYAVMLGIFAAVAALLAAIGIYGLIAYSVTQRTREIGIRMALGAERGQVLALVLRQGIILAVIGIVLGLAGAAVVTRNLASMLFGLTPLDPITFLAVSFSFAAVAVLASYVPARRATKVDPLVALRYE